MSNRYASALFASVLAVSFSAGTALALEGADGTDYFSEVPVLVDADHGDTRFNQFVDVSIVVPETETKAMQAVVIEQEQNPKDLDVSADDISVVVGQEFMNDASEVPASVSFGEANGHERILVEFERPVQPGHAITIHMEPDLTQELTGTYLFGVSALPAGDKPRDYFLGFARTSFTIEDSSSSDG